MSGRSNVIPERGRILVLALNNSRPQYTGSLTERSINASDRLPAPPFSFSRIASTAVWRRKGGRMIWR